MGFNILRKKKGVEILLVLLRGAKGIREIQQAVGGSNSTIYNRLKELREADLIQEEFLTGMDYGQIPPGRKLIRLTQKGRNLAESMVESHFVKPLLLRKTRERWIIGILYVLKTVSGRTRFMKLLFLLKYEFGFSKRELGSFYKFRPWKFGPFSKEILEDIEELQDDGFVDIEPKAVPQNEFTEDQKFIHIYKLTKAGEDVVEEALENLPQGVLRKLSGLNDFNNMSLPDLLGYVYTKYPKFVKESMIVERILQNQSIDVVDITNPGRNNPPP